MTPRCPHLGGIEIGDEVFEPEEIIAKLESYISPRRKERIDGVISRRTYTVAPVMEGLYDRGNISAVVRSAEALGYQSLHNIETSSRFKKAKRVTQGAEKWLDIQAWQSTRECIDGLRDRGYRIVATTLVDAHSIRDVDCMEPMALVFGNEKDGVSPEMIEAADDRVILPMDGFTQSLNISVAAALCLHYIAEERRRNGGHGDLSEEEITALTASYYLRSTEHGAGVMLETRGKILNKSSQKNKA